MKKRSNVASAEELGPTGYDLGLSGLSGSSGLSGAGEGYKDGIAVTSQSMVDESSRDLGL